MGQPVHRNIHRLSALRIAKVTKPGYYADGGGLTLQVSHSGTKSWIFRFMLDGRAREMGLGPLHTIALAEARSKAMICRKQLLENIDPIEARRAQRGHERLQSARSMTFTACAAAYIAAHRVGWRNAKHATQWHNTLASYADPVFGALPVQEIDIGLVLRALEPIWHSKPETASRVRGRIESVLDWATVRGLRKGDNPARWRGHLESLLPSRAKLQVVEHHAALPYDQMALFMVDLHAQTGIAARALQFLILTAARTSEVIGARWDEFNLELKTWVVPAVRMKAHRDHRVPLSPHALKVIEEMRAIQTNEFVFPGARAGKALSNMAMLMLLKRMHRGNLTAHGFRSTFRDWAAEQTNYPREVAEEALAHTLNNKVEAAYRRGDLFEKRQRLMMEWAKYCQARKMRGNIIPIRKVTTVA
ncbi:MAG: integrase arm-type DNA-binding domain-containing protein [Burkholderiales bacterium]